MEHKRGKVIPFRHPGRERRRVAVFLAVLAVLALLLAFFAVDSGRNWDRVRRFFAYGNKRLDISMDTEAAASAELNGRLVTAGLDGVTLYDDNGKESFVVTTSLHSPVLQTGGGLILAFDAGGTELLLLDEAGTMRLEQRPDTTIFDGDIASDGAMCYVTAGDRDKSRLQVFDKSQLACFTVYASTRYFTACTVAPGADYVCAVALGQSEGAFDAQAVIYRTDREEPVAGVSLGNQLIYDVEFWGDERICAVGETALVVFDTDGEILGRYDYTGLNAYDLDGDGFAALLLPMGAGSELVTVDGKGRELARTELGAGSKVDVQGTYVATLTPSGLTISGKKLEAWSNTSDVGAANNVCMCSNGMAYYLDAHGAHRYLP